MSHFDGLGPYIFDGKMEDTQPKREEEDEKLFICRQRRQFSFIDDMNKVIFLSSSLNWRLNIYVSHQGKDKNRRNENTNLEDQSYC